MSLSAAKKRDILICCIVALLILCAMAARILGSPEGAPGLGSMIRNGIYMGLTAAWGVSVQRRIIQAQTRRYLIAIALLMLLWLTERTVKYEFNLSAASARRLWYSYYIPILLIPLITVFTAMSLGRPENYKLPGWTRLLYIPTFAFMAMVLTNDRHQLVFAFPADAEIWTGGNAAHSIGYFAVVAWTAVCAAGTIIVMIEKCRRPKSRIQWLPILPVALSFVYTALYVSDVKWLRLIAGDMTVFQCLAIMAALEGCIRCGLIQSNTGYDELFGATTIGAQITDHGFRVKSASHSALPISLEKMEQALEGPVQLDKNTLLKGQEISSGYVFWQEDISELQGVLDQFQTVQDEYNTLEDNLSEEINQRVNLGNDLTDKITKETSDRKTADSSIEGKISTEISDRKRADNSLEIKISDEVNSRQEADDELSGRIEYEKMERQADNEENKSRFFEKADKTELYGREKNITHKITHSLKKSDFIININAGNGNGTVTINSLPVQTKIFRDGRAYIQTAPISASFSAEKGEEGEKWINLLYDCDNGTLGLEVTEQPESGNVAKMNVTYMKAEVAEIYAGIIRFEGLNTLDALKTNNRDSFVGAINELVSGKVGANDIVNGKDASYRVTDLLKWVAEGLEKSNSVNYPGLDYIISDVYEMYNALCSYGFQEPIEVVKTVAELKNQAENK